MKVRLSTIQKGRKFVYRGATYEMLNPKPTKSKVTGGTFRWVKKEGNPRASMFSVNGNIMVTLLRETEPKTAAEILGTAPPKRSSRRETPRVILGKGAHQYRVTARWADGDKWWHKPGIHEKVFYVHADSAAAAIAVVENSRKGNVKVRYHVARNEN